MLFRSEYPAIKLDHRLRPEVPLITMGSCFSEHIGQRLRNAGFQTKTNPFGIIYNPLSLWEHLERIISGDEPGEEEFLSDDSSCRWWKAHGHFRATDASELKAKIRVIDAELRAFFELGATLFITLGTANVYQHSQLGFTVANCHKQQASDFEKIRLDVQEIYFTGHTVLERLLDTYPNVKVVLSVSPVKHLREGLRENTLSKAVLLLAAESLCQDRKEIYYFPSYELLVEDLRDYRFFDTDMAHPGKLAIEYIWERFTGAFFDDTVQRYAADCEAVMSLYDHKVMDVNSPENQKFIQIKKERVLQLLSKYPMAHLRDLFKND